MFGYQFLFDFLQYFDIVGYPRVLGRWRGGIQFPQLLYFFVVIIGFLLELLIVKEHVVAADI